MLLLEIGNSTLKSARPSSDGSIVARRHPTVDDLLGELGREEEILCAAVGETLAGELFRRIDRGRIVLLNRAAFLPFIGASYDTPATLGLDRILNLYALEEDGIVISCGTAITVDAMVDGVPRWGAILPGFTTSADGLHARIPVLPHVSVADRPRLPARTSRDSVVNGVLLAAALAARGIARRLVAGRDDLPIIITGGDAGPMRELLEEGTIDQVLLFRGMLRARSIAGVAGSSGGEIAGGIDATPPRP